VKQRYFAVARTIAPDLLRIKSLSFTKCTELTQAISAKFSVQKRVISTTTRLMESSRRLVLP